MAARRRALQNDPQLQRYVIPNVRTTGKQLGVGSYGSVEELEINSLICAGKRIHESLIGAGNAGVQNIVKKYVEECQLMSDLRHPHIVQFMGVCFLPDSSLPILVMERLLMSLDDLLESTPDIFLALKRSMLADVSKGLVYLHNRSSPIIHRDLSAKNILLNSAMAAKISDLGNSRIVDLQAGQLVKTLSCMPGTQVYMPPEALYCLPGYEADKSLYGTKIDIFSFGHLSLFTITQVGIFANNSDIHNMTTSGSFCTGLPPASPTSHLSRPQFSWPAHCSNGSGTPWEVHRSTSPAVGREAPHGPAGPAVSGQCS